MGQKDELFEWIMYQNPKSTIQEMIFLQETKLSYDDELHYGPVKVVKGRHKGRIGCYDDDTDSGKSAYVYWGNMVSVLDSYDIIRKGYLSGQITMYDLVMRGVELQNTIARMRCEQQYKSIGDDDYQEITDLYGEYVYIMGYLNKVYESTFYLQGEGKMKVFISHSSKDKDIALWIATDLKRAKYDVWFDKWDLELGHSVPEGIGAGLDEADVLLVLLSANYLKSAFCADEWEAYYMKFNTSKKPIIIIILDESEPPTLLAARKYFRMTEMEDYNDMMIELQRALSKIQKK